MQAVWRVKRPTHPRSASRVSRLSDRCWNGVLCQTGPWSSATSTERHHRARPSWRSHDAPRRVPDPSHVRAVETNHRRRRRKMKRLMTVAAVLVTSLLVTAGTAAANPTDPAKKPGTVDVQLLTVSDWHGQLTPASGIGGAAFLKTYFDQARAANPNTLTFMAGD